MKFKYIALTANNQKVDGILDSVSLDSAKEDLHKMELSIIAIEEISDKEYTQIKEHKRAEDTAHGVSTFTFNAIDQNRKIVEGTIDAQDGYTAYKRLVIEYDFKVNSLHLPGDSPVNEEDEKQKLMEWERQLQTEGIKKEKPRARDELAETETQLDQELIVEIDKIIKTAKGTLSDHANLFTAERLREIQSVLSELERVRTSNNVKHITEISTKLFDLIHAPDAPDQQEASREYKNNLNQLRQSGLIQSQSKIYEKVAGLKKVKDIFNSFKRQLKSLGKKPEHVIRIKKELQEEYIKAQELELPAWKSFFYKLKEYITSKNPLVKKAKMEELLNAWKKWKLFRQSQVPPSKPTTAAKKDIPEKESEKKEASPEKTHASPKKAPPQKRDFGLFFMEVDSFVSWLLFFYIIYFFAVNFSIEKNMGLPSAFTVKTLQSPLVLNITIFLLFSHLILRIKTRAFHQNWFGSIFLFLFGYGIFALLIFNF